MQSKIISSYLPEISALIFGRSKPNLVSVNLTNQCDQNCIYCEIGRNIPSQNKGVLTIDDLKWIIDQMAVNKIRRMALCGGEPFLFKGIIDIVAYAGENKIRCAITTNGMTAYKLTENELNILKECKAEINISIDSFKNSIQVYTRGTSSALSNALKSIQKLNEKHIPVTVLSVITKFNYHDLFNFFKEAYKKGIKQVLFQPVIYYSNYPDRPPVVEKTSFNVSMDNIDILMVELSKILRFERKYKISTNVYRIFPWIEYYLKTAATGKGWFFNDVLKKFYCREIHAIIDISYYGGIQPCCLALAATTIHENRHLGLIALWSKATLEIKNDLLNGRYRNYCNSCCNHFSRNMLASIFKYPISNRIALINILSLIILRSMSGILKKKKYIK